jgi:hypothetical protein
MPEKLKEYIKANLTDVLSGAVLIGMFLFMVFFSKGCD